MNSLISRMFSKKCEYAIRALMFIAQRSEKGLRVGIKAVAKEISAPEPFIAKILQELVQKDVVQSAKGPNGGFIVNETPQKNTLAVVVKAIDGNTLFLGCGMGLKNCSEKHPCPLRDKFKVIRKEIFDMLCSIAVGEFNSERERGLRHLRR